MKYNISFADYILIETQTISQYLKSPKGAIISKQLTVEIKNVIRDRLGRFPALNGKIKDVLVNYFLYILVIGNTGLLADNRFMNAEVVGNIVATALQPYIDFLIANKDNNQLLAKLNTTTYNMGELSKDAEAWHEELKKRKAIGPEGRTILELSDIGMKGWQWVSLDRGYCKKEGDAAGHCGNAGYREGDNILSLRDPQGGVHLTFIVNNGILGESKGRDNNKPSKKYHAAIMKLLLSPFITSIRGGGYAPHNNFKIDDLSEKDKNILLAEKPNIDFYDYAFKTGDKDTLEELFNARFYSIDKKDPQNPIIVITTTEGLEDLYDTIKGSDKEVDNFYQIEQNIQEHAAMNYEFRLNDAIDDLNKEMEDAISDYFIGEELGVYDDEGYLDLHKSIKQDDEIESALQRAAGYAYENAVYAAFYKDLKNQLESLTKNGFYIDLDNDYSIKISLKHAGQLYKSEEHEGHFDNYSLDSLYDFKYQAGDYDYGFDRKLYNNHLLEELPRDVHKYIK